MHTKRFSIPDPIAGKIEFPEWLVNIKDEPAVRRMLTIRQLGLKAYIDFPGAIHTRYSHVLGAMHLAGKVVDILDEILRDDGKRRIAENLKESRTDLMAAGFLHDIAHGPFSHAVDYPLQVISGTNHEELAAVMIREHLPKDLSNWIDTEKVIKIIQGKHDYPFISQIINGQLDVDKLDYLLRDAHHVGLKYSFDLESFLSHYTVIGEESELTKCSLGLEDTLQATVTAELFLVIWKSMYDLVYHAQNSRIAEKMLEKSVLLGQTEEKLKTAFTLEYLKLDDEGLIEILRSLQGPSSDLANRAISNQLFKLEIDKKLTTEKFEMTEQFIAEATDSKNVARVSDNLSLKLNEKFQLKNYQLICDIVTSKSPQDIELDSSNGEEEEKNTLRARSTIVGHLTKRSRIKVYQDGMSSKQIKEKDIDTILKEAIEEEAES